MFNATAWSRKRELRIYSLLTLKRAISLSGSDESCSANGLKKK